MKQRRLKWLLAIAAAAILIGIALFSWDRLGGARFEQLKNDAYNPIQQAIDWPWLQQQNPDTRAWLHVKETGIDTPVTCTPPTDPSYYLSHDFWGAPSFRGCPFLAADCDPDLGSQLVYGHHLIGSNEAFSALHDRWKQERFKQLGPCVWSTPQTPSLQLHPLCAILTDKYDQEVQWNEFHSSSELQAQLRRLCLRAHARNDDWERICSQAIRCVKLVTCSSSIAGQAQRCCVVFAA